MQIIFLFDISKLVNKKVIEEYAMSGVGGVNGPGGPYGVEGDSGGSEDFSPAGIAASQLLDKALKIIFGEGVKDTSLASPMSLAGQATKKSGSQDVHSIPASFFSNWSDYNRVITLPQPNPERIKGIVPPGGNNQSYGTSESLCMAMQYFVAVGTGKLPDGSTGEDKFKLCLNTYNYLVANGNADKQLPAWAFKEDGTVVDPGSASDFDISLTGELIKAARKFPDLTATLDPTIKKAISGIADHDINSSGLLTKGDQPGEPTIQDAHYWDYINYGALADITNYAQDNNMSSEADTIAQAGLNDMTFQTNIFHNGTPQQISDYFNNSADNSATQSRELMYLSNFLLNYSAADCKNPTMKTCYNSCLGLLGNLVSKGFSTPDPWYSSRNIFGFDPSTSHAQIREYNGFDYLEADGPMLLALAAIKKAGYGTTTYQQKEGTTPTIDDMVAQLTSTFKTDLQTGGKDYQDTGLGAWCYTMMCDAGILPGQS